MLLDAPIMMSVMMTAMALMVMMIRIWPSAMKYERGPARGAAADARHAPHAAEAEHVRVRVAHGGRHPGLRAAPPPPAVHRVAAASVHPDTENIFIKIFSPYKYFSAHLVSFPLWRMLVVGWRPSPRTTVSPVTVVTTRLPTHVLGLLQM